jgi:hypothetical protein
VQKITALDTDNPWPPEKVEALEQAMEKLRSIPLELQRTLAIGLQRLLKGVQVKDPEAITADFRRFCAGQCWASASESFSREHLFWEWLLALYRTKLVEDKLRAGNIHPGTTGAEEPWVPGVRTIRSYLQKAGKA